MIFSGDFTGLTDVIGDKGAEALGGLIVGLIFGIAAQQSKFCLRSATIEFWRGSLGPKTAIWLLTFGAALFSVQMLFITGQLNTQLIRQLTSVGTMSGAIIGGFMFGSGMILARGCASRLLVLSATGNLRALVAGLILTVAAQASLRGILSPFRLEISRWWMIGPDTRDMMNYLPEATAITLGILTLILAFYLAYKNRLSLWTISTSLTVGGAVALGWWYTTVLSTQTFELVLPQSVSFTGPSTDTLMALINRPDVPWSFGIGMVPGVFIGSAFAALFSGQMQLQTFSETAPLPRYIVGATLMGFGSMLAGGCAVGAGVTGGSVMALTAWVALFCMWLGAGITDRLVDQPKDTNPSTAEFTADPPASP